MDQLPSIYINMENSGQGVVNFDGLYVLLWHYKAHMINYYIGLNGGAKET